jgi:hypothetical protein
MSKKTTLNMVIFTRVLGIAAVVMLIVSCFMPWAYYPDLKEYFTGFYSAVNKYGKPAKFLITVAIISLVCQLVPKLFLKRLNIFLVSLNLAYAIRNYILYAACYRGICPDKQTGLYLMLFSSIALMVVALMSSNAKGAKVVKGE